MAYRKETNPFYMDEDADEQQYDKSREPPLSLQAQKENSANRQLEGTRRALTSLDESQQIGVATAEELLRQGEQLDNTERKITDINQTTKVTQRHLNGIKSVFGGMKNWWYGRSATDEARTSSDEAADAPRSRLERAVQKEEGTTEHPVLRLRSEDTRSAPTSSYEKQLDDNLALMSSGLSNLQELAVGLGNEMDKQNDQLDRVGGRVERADVTLRDQNRQMRGILGK